MKITKKAVSLILCLMLVVSLLTVAVVSTSAAANAYSDAAMALDKEYAYDGELGALYSPESTTFKVWAPLATEVKLNRYATGSDDEDGAEDLGVTNMEKLMDGASWTGVWAVTVEGDLKNTYYTYSITNPTTILNTGSVTHETQDIYSYAVGVNGDRTMVVDLDATDPDGWAEDRHVFVDSQADAIVWEVQVKDFSYNPNSGVSEANRGKYLAFTETGTTLNNEGKLSTGIDYLKQLGVTHVQINPFYDFATIDEQKNVTDDSEFNWGYDPKNYGVPEGSYSTNPFDGNVRINEAKQMIKALHDAGIGVIMDVVYNHTYSIDSCFNYSVPEYYYRMAANGSYSQQSGCGNDTASERAMYRKYMREMLAYWTNEYHIDGYRFDLMGVHDVETMNLIRDDMDAVDPRIIMYGEGWGGNTVFDPLTCAGTPTEMCTQTNASITSPRIGFFNDQIRDGIKAGVFDGATAPGFVSGNMLYAPDISYGVRANTFGKGSRWSALSPEQCVTYASCHDNMTLYDKLVAINHSSTADYRVRYADCIAQNKLTAAIISSAQGIDFILAGEEMGRSKDGDENSYKSAATLNMIDWSLIKTNADLVSYYKGMFELRKAFSPFTASVKDADDDSYAYYFSTSMTGANNYVAYTVENKTEGEWNKVAVLYNGSKNASTIELLATADPSVSEDTEWIIVANDKSAGVSALGEAKGLSFEVPAASAVIAVEKSTFEAADIQSALSKVVVNNIYEKTGEVISSSTILGTEGSGYVVAADESIPLKYTLSRVDGGEEGVFAKDDIAVDYYYTDFVPAHFTPEAGDVSGDEKVTIIDATYIQRHLADIEKLSDEALARGDYNYDGKTSIIDVTFLQRYLADMNVSVFKVTTNYTGVRDGNDVRVAQSVSKDYRLGDKYATDSASVAFYVLDETPANAEGVVTGDISVTYHYTYTVTSPVMHVKHSGDLTWNPSLWAWAYDSAGTPINCYSGWPGLALKDPDENGWYTTEFPIPGGLDYYFIISKNGSPQTADYGPIAYETYPEIWVVIDDENVGKGSNWIQYYNYNPDAANG